MDDLAAWLDQILKEEAAAAVPRVTIFSGGSPGLTTPRCIADRPLPGADRICQWQLEPATEAPLWWDAAMREHDRAHLDEKGQHALARIAADRQILELHGGAHDCQEIRTGTYPGDWPEAASWGTPGGKWRHAVGEHFEDEPCPTVRLLALPYADRPGYQEAWRPA